MSHDTLLRIAKDLEKQGVDTRVLRDLENELATIEAPPGIFGRMTAAVKGSAKRNWGRMVGEVGESRELFSLIQQRIKNEQPLSNQEKAKIKSQLADLFKVVPAGFIAATNTILPIPGTSMLTPILLVKMGLMPSRWREAHILNELRKQSKHLRETGHLAEAAELDALQQRIGNESDAREDASQRAALLTHWDKDNNGVLDEEEKRVYQIALRQLQTKALQHGSEERWFLKHNGQVMGPVNLDHLKGVDLDSALLVCFDGKSGWVALEPILEDL
ncbi:MAG: hypothetical protein GWP91_22460 [Rhodobacterales bacterium]|nr:hypothetical protein [Rhodobacterales bacterium]